jgi:hypothetical protein
MKAMLEELVRLAMLNLFVSRARLLAIAPGDLVRTYESENREGRDDGYVGRVREVFIAADGLPKYRVAIQVPEQYTPGGFREHARVYGAHQLGAIPQRDDSAPIPVRR